MVVVDRILDCRPDEHCIETEIVVSEKSLFYESAIGGVPAYAAMEYFAQSVGCFAGIFDLSQNPPRKPSVGFLLGTRKFDSTVGVLRAGRYTVRARELFFDSEIASFETEIFDVAGTPLCSAILNVYRPTDLEQFKKQYT